MSLTDDLALVTACRRTRRTKPSMTGRTPTNTGEAMNTDQAQAALADIPSTTDQVIFRTPAPTQREADNYAAGYADCYARFVAALAPTQEER